MWMIDDLRHIRERKLYIYRGMKKMNCNLYDMRDHREKEKDKVKG